MKRTYAYKVIGDLRIHANVYRKADEIIKPSITVDDLEYVFYQIRQS